MKSQMNCGLEFESRRLTKGILKIMGEALPSALLVCYLEEGFPLCYANSQLLHYLGYTLEELMEKAGRSMFALVHPQDRERVQKCVGQSRLGDGRYAVQYRMLRKDGNAVWVRDTGRTAVAEDGRLILVRVCMDISESMHMQERMDVRNQEIIHLIDSLPCGICKVRLDSSYSILYANQIYYGLYGYTAEQAEEEGFHAAKFVIQPDDFQELRKKVQSHLACGHVSFELEHRAIDRYGEALWMLARCSYNKSEPDCFTAVMIDITDRKRMEDQLRISEEELRIAFQHTDKMIDIYEVPSRTLIQPQKAADLLGLPPLVANVPDSFVEQGIVAQESASGFVRFFESMIRGDSVGDCVFQFRVLDGQLRWYAARYTMVYDRTRKPKRAIISYEDITIQREKELAYQKWSQYFEAQQEGSLGYYEYNLTKNKFERSENEPSENPPPDMQTFTGSVQHMAKVVYEEDRKEYLRMLDREFLLLKYLDGTREVRFEHRRNNKNGRCIWTLCVVQMIPDPYTDDIKAFVQIKDIDDKKREALELEKLSKTDSLTGLYNRAALKEKIAGILKEPGSGGNLFIMIDIDRFKSINDSLGHQFGDFVLKDFSAVLSRSLKEGDFGGRIGGDEFVLFWRDAGPRCEAERRLEGLCAGLVKSYKCGVRLSASLGVSCAPKDGATFEELYRKADFALYEAKRLGRSQYAFYHPEMDGRLPCQWAAE